MAYDAVLEACDLALAVDAESYLAMELKAQAMIRVDPSSHLEATKLLDVALELVEEGCGEGLSLQARINKERWRQSWFSAAMPTAEDVPSNRKFGLRDARFLLKAIKLYRDDFERVAEEDYYPAVNAVSLMIIAQDLGVREPAMSADEWAAEIERLQAAASKCVKRALDASTDDLASQEARYWALATRAELAIVGAREITCGGPLPDGIREDLDAAVVAAGCRPFLLHSTLEQLCMFVALGFRSTLVGKAITVLEGALGGLRQPPPPMASVHTETAKWFEQLVETLDDESDARNWAKYLKSADCLRVFGSFCLRFEPIEEITTPRGRIIGFEVLGCDSSGRNYPLVRRAAMAAGISAPDFNLALFAFALRTVHALREVLNAGALRRETEGLFFSINLDPDTIAHRSLRCVLDNYFSAKDRHAIPFELNESFPVLPKDLSRSAETAAIREACNNLLALRTVHGFELVFDDSNALRLPSRLRLREACTKSKADFTYTSTIMEICLPQPDAHKVIPMELQRCSVPGRPFVIEGVGDNLWYDFFQKHWPEGCVPTSMQGWSIKIPETWLSAFCPVDEARADMPRGYYLRTEVLDELGLY